MPRRRDASCGAQKFRVRISGILRRIARGGVWSARWAVPMEGGYLAFWRETRVSRRKCQFLAERAALNGEGLSVSPSGARAARSRSAVETPLHFLRRFRVRIRRRAPARPLSSVRHNIRRTSGHLRSPYFGEDTSSCAILRHGVRFDEAGLRAANQ